MKVKEMKSILESNKFDNYECNFKLKTVEPKVTLESLAKTLDDVMKEIKAIHNRIDNLVAKNNLKE